MDLARDDAPVDKLGSFPNASPSRENVFSCHKERCAVGNFSEVVYAVSSMQGWRPEQEDSHLIKQAFPVNANGIFGVFDGHGGTFASHFMKKIG